jgi:hypothetical protein
VSGKKTDRRRAAEHGKFTSQAQGLTNATQEADEYEPNLEERLSSSDGGLIDARNAGANRRRKQNQI